MAGTTLSRTMHFDSRGFPAAVDFCVTILEEAAKLTATSSETFLEDSPDLQSLP